MRKKPRILVIDDNDSVREVIYESLAECGYEVTVASDGEQGLAMIDSDDLPCVVITDIIMPRREGLEIIMEIRRKYPSVRIIAISGGGRTKTMDFLDLARKMGADAVLPKPLNMEDMEQTIEKLTRLG